MKFKNPLQIGLLIYFFLFFLFFATDGIAQTHTREIGVKIENDAFLAKKSDRYYTDGFFINYNVAVSIKKENRNLANKVWNFEAGQKIFNPFTFIINPQNIDRPYAAYLYFGGGLNLLYKKEENIKLKVETGIIGPEAKGEEVQKFIHHIFHFPKPYGWQYQIKNTFVLNFSGEFNKLIKRISWIDASVTTFLNAGTAFNSACAGPLFRIGKFNTLYNSASTQSSAIKNKLFTSIHSNELIFFYKPQVQLLVFDATIQGSLFKKHSFDNNEITLTPNKFLIKQQLGFIYSSSHLTANVAATYCTKEIKRMLFNHQWGSIAILYNINN